MGYASNAMSAYAAASQMVTSLQAVVMLYDGMIKEIRAAKSAIEDGRIEDRFNATQKASKILLGLQANLDFEQGGQVSLMLDRFYHTCFADLQKINLRNCTQTCDSLCAALAEVRGSWSELAEKEPAGGAGKPAAAGAQTEAAPGPAPTSSGLALSV